MKVTNLRLKNGRSFELTASVESPGLVRSRSFSVFYRFPSDFAGSVQISADPFIAALIVIAMRVGEPLIVDAPISQALLKALPKIKAFYHNLDPMFKMIAIKTSGRRELGITSLFPNEALFFSCGIDSFYALVKSVDTPTMRNLTHLIFVHGFDINLSDFWRFERTRMAAEEVASHYEKKLIVVASNIREITDQYLSWAYCWPGVMASVAICLSGFFKTIYVAPDFEQNDVSPVISPDLDSQWSKWIETSAFAHYSYGVGRIAKAAALASNCLAQKYLRVCWENRRGAYNCGRCSKCVRTMLTLHLAGALPKFNFLTTLTPELVERTDFQLDSLDPSVMIITKRIISELRSKGESQFADSLSQAVKRTYRRRPLEALKAWILNRIWARRILLFVRATFN